MAEVLISLIDLSGCWESCGTVRLKHRYGGMDYENDLTFPVHVYFCSYSKKRTNISPHDFTNRIFKQVDALWGHYFD